MEVQPGQLTQKALDLDGGEAAYSERLNDIELAMDRLGKHCDAEMSLFLRLIFSYTHGGAAGLYRRSLAQLATRRNLCCGRTKAAQVVETAERWGLVTVTRSRRTDGAPVSNEYALCWPGIRHVRINGTPWCLEDTGYAAPHTRYTAGRTRYTAGRTRYAAGRTLCKEKQSSCCQEAKIRTGPEAVAGAGPTSADPENLGMPVDRLREELLRTVPELIAVAGVMIAPSQPAKLLYGIWAALEGKHIADQIHLVNWFRSQLGTPHPVMQGTEADLLLCVAAGIYAQRRPESEVLKNRVALFVNTVANRKWRRVTPYVSAARVVVDQAAEKLGAEFVGQKMDPAS
jgi:hypothetical protein